MCILTGMNLDRRHIDDLYSIAAASSGEICGVLVGRRSPRLVVDTLIPARNLHPTPQSHFLLDAHTLLHADAQARNTGAQIIGFYHSHPNGSALPSPQDRRDAWPGYVYLIVALEHGSARYICAWLCHKDGTFRPEPILPIAS
jgi:desampylase